MLVLDAKADREVEHAGTAITEKTQLNIYYFHFIYDSYMYIYIRIYINSSPCESRAGRTVSKGIIDDDVVISENFRNIAL